MPSYPLLVDTAFYTQGATINDAVLGGAWGGGPGPTLSIADASVTEGNSGTAVAAFTVTLAPASTQTVTVSFATANGSAVSGGDYSAASGTLSFSPGATSQSIEVSVVGDTSLEADEAFTVTLSAPVNAALGRATATGTIVNDDTGPTEPPTPVVWTSLVGVSANANSLTKTAAAAWGTAGAVSVQSLASGDGFVEFTASETTTYRMLGLSKGNSDQNYTDVDFAIYPATGGTLYVYEKGVSAGIFGNYSTGDKLRVAVEGGVVRYRRNGTLIYTSTVTPSYPLLADTALYSQGATINSAVVGGPWTGGPGPTLSIADASVTEGNSGTAVAAFTVTLAPASTQTVTVSFATANGSAVSGGDYSAASGTLSFSPGATSQSIEVSVVGDTTVEADEAFTVTLSAPLNAMLGQANATGTIVNDDSAPPGPPTPVVWTSLVGVSANGNSLTKTAPSAWGNAGAVSVQSLASGDGFVEFTASETTTYRMLGLSNGNSDQNYTDVDFAIYPAPSGGLYVYQKGVGTGAFVSYATGDKLRVAVEGGVVRYRKNGTLIYTSTVPPTYPLLVDTALYSQGATLNSAVVGGAW